MTLACDPEEAIAQDASNGVQITLLGHPHIMATHPDLRYRKLAIRAYESGDKAAALNPLRKAASYADKPSQAMLATMYWNGDGTPAVRRYAERITTRRRCGRQPSTPG
ncbi:MAG: hypothetical protein EPN56_10530 [Rhodanobacter sp.]|nr:MAG: hypothetical protein EPN78_13895 [Rhodanobacter sp.]TAM07853.1 MAG: hypothetical protein EPN66_14060 [Rhodanobacter sp.]TAM35035.1 MAG: hypothetical protein EPN56_10530 [Rhodanobacter sp.]